MKKMRMDVCHMDEFGETANGQVVQRPDPVADLYVQKGYGIILEELKPDAPEPVDDPDETRETEIETGESKMGGIETADLPIAKSNRKLTKKRR